MYIRVRNISTQLTWYISNKHLLPAWKWIHGSIWLKAWIIFFIIAMPSLPLHCLRKLKRFCNKTMYLGMQKVQRKLRSYSHVGFLLIIFNRCPVALKQCAELWSDVCNFLLYKMYLQFKGQSLRRPKSQPQVDLSLWLHIWACQISRLLSLCITWAVMWIF